MAGYPKVNLFPMQLVEPYLKKPIALPWYILNADGEAVVVVGRGPRQPLLHPPKFATEHVIHHFITGK